MTSSSTDYIGNLILKDGHPEMLQLDDGYVSFDSDTISGIHYYIQDYIGNNRMVVNGRTDSIEQVTHYYPYGGVIGDISTNESLQRFKFEGKELDRTFGLDNYDIHARSYFAMAPMWDRPDKLAHKYYGISPYVYCGGDPVNFGDYDGREIRLNGDSTQIAQTISYYNQGAGNNVFSYDYDANKVIYTASDNPNTYESTIGNIANSDKLVELNLTSGNRQVLVGDWYLHAIDLGDISGMESRGFDPSRVLLHETVEQFNLDWTVINNIKKEYLEAKRMDDTHRKNILGGKINELVIQAHDRALRAESQCFKLGGNPSNDIFPYWNNAKSGFFVVREPAGRLFVMPYVKMNIK